MTKQSEDLLVEHKEAVVKALGHLEYSLKKVSKLPTRESEQDEETFETWESFSSRLPRVVDLFLTKYVRGYVLKNDPGFDGSLRDFVDQAEKLGLINSADQWMDFRRLRNTVVHEYAGEELENFFKDLKKAAKEVVKIRKLL